MPDESRHKLTKTARAYLESIMAKQRTRTHFEYPKITPTTGWFSPNVVPIREGEYEVERVPHWDDDVRVIDRMKFHSGHWFQMAGEMSECGLGILRWRGLAQRSS